MSEREHTTRRAPHMERYVTVTQFANSEPWRVRLSVGVQSFEIGDGYDDREDAEWTRDMLCIALDALAREQR
jgi:hypothetical protein